MFDFGKELAGITFDQQYNGANYFCVNSNLFTPLVFHRGNTKETEENIICTPPVTHFYDPKISHISFPVRCTQSGNIINLENKKNLFDSFSIYFDKMVDGSPMIITANNKTVLMSYYNHMSMYNRYGCGYYFEPNNQTLYEIKENQTNSMTETPYKVLLPVVTEADNGKILKVVNGQWQAVDPE